MMVLARFMRQQGRGFCNWGGRLTELTQPRPGQARPTQRIDVVGHKWS
jgi:hypothetical protein